jgi:hypothetical protein
MFINVIEIGFGLLFLVGAIFSLSYILRHGKEFYGSFAASAWFGPSRKLVRNFLIIVSFVFNALTVWYAWKWVA